MWNESDESCPIENNTMTWPGLEPRPLDAVTSFSAFRTYRVFYSLEEYLRSTLSDTPQLV